MPVQVHKYREIGTVREGASPHWGVDHIQPFFPSLEVLFKTDNLENVKDHGLKLTEGIQSVIGKKTIQTTKGETVDVHIKQSSILSPVKWMRGDYGTTVGLPTTKESAVGLNELGSLWPDKPPKTKCNSGNCISFKKFCDNFSFIL
jgi:hypothetical protein